MIECTNCDCPLFLRLVDGEFEAGTNGDPEFVEEHYECVRCDSRGYYRYVSGVETVGGCIRRTEDAPRSICGHKRRAER